MYVKSSLWPPKTPEKGDGGASVFYARRNRCDQGKSTKGIFFGVNPQVKLGIGANNIFFYFWKQLMDLGFETSSSRGAF